MNCEGPYFAKMFFQNFCPCFDIVFPQLEIIPRTRNKFVEIVAVAERYLIITHVKNKESKQLPFRICLHVKLAEGRISKKGRISLYLIYNIVSLGKMARNRTYFIKISRI